jgi:mono/diheme cytochrome c family protein
MRRTALLAILVLAAAGALANVAADQTTGPKQPPLMIQSMYGPDLFNHYCASCHGRDGKGQGPAAAALKTAPPDLTILAKQHGRFPRGRVAAVIGGESSVPFLPSHGSREMPVWGPLFRYLDPDHRATDVRIENLVSHLESLQVR